MSAPATATTSDLTSLIAAGQRFGCIYADPPWLYNNQTTRAAASNHYHGMNVADLCDMPIRDLAADDAHLHLWVTNAFLFDAFRIITAWGFAFRDTLVWCKPDMGLGNYWRNSHEILMTASRGADIGFGDQMSSAFSCRRGQHSAKPEQVRTMIKRASSGPYLEMFGRREVAGWTVFGDQIEADLFSGAAQ